MGQSHSRNTCTSPVPTSSPTVLASLQKVETILTGGGRRSPSRADSLLTSSLPHGIPASVGGGQIWVILTCATLGLACSSPSRPLIQGSGGGGVVSLRLVSTMDRGSSRHPQGACPCFLSPQSSSPGTPHGRFLAQICHFVLNWGPGHYPGQTAEINRGGRSPPRLLGLPGTKELGCRGSGPVLAGTRWGSASQGQSVSPPQGSPCSGPGVGRSREGRGPEPQL